MRQRTIDKVVCERFIKPANGKEVVIAMGAVAFSSCMKGNKPVPKNKLIMALSKKVTVIMYNTSQKCSCCHSQLKGMKKEGKIVYGVRQCMKCCIDNSESCNVTHDRKKSKVFTKKSSIRALKLEKQLNQSRNNVSSTCLLLDETRTQSFDQQFAENNFR